MKQLLLLSAIFCLANNLFAQATSPDYIASTGGIGLFKTGMTPLAIEKLLNTKLKLSKTAQSNSYDYDTVKTSYKDMQLQLVFTRTYTGNDTATRVTLYSVQSSYPQIKTKSGVGIGDDKLKIVKTYEQFRLTIMPEWSLEGKPNQQRSTVTLYDNENPKVLIFYLDNNIITRIESTAYEGE